MHSGLHIRDFIGASDKDRRLQIMRQIGNHGPVSALEFAEMLGAKDTKDIKTVGRVFTYLRDNKFLAWHRNESQAVVANRCNLTPKALQFVGGQMTVPAAAKATPAQKRVEIQIESRPAPVARVTSDTPASALPGYLPAYLTDPAEPRHRAEIFGKYLIEPRTASELAAVLGLSVKSTTKLLHLGIEDGAILGSDDELQRYVLTVDPQETTDAVPAPAIEVVAEAPHVPAKVDRSEPKIQVIPARKRRDRLKATVRDAVEDVEESVVDEHMRQPAILLHKEDVVRPAAPEVEQPVDTTADLAFLASIGATVTRLRTATGSPLGLKDRDELEQMFGRFFSMAHFGALVMPRTLWEYIKMSKLADDVAKRVVDLAMQFGIVEPVAADSNSIQRLKLRGVYRNLSPSESVRAALQRIDGVRTAGNRRSRKKAVWVGSSAATRAFAR